MKHSETLTKYPHERRHAVCENTTLSSERQRAEMRLSEPANSGNDLKSKSSISGMLHHLMVWQVKWNIPFKEESWLKECIIAVPWLSRNTQRETYSVSYNGQKGVFHGESERPVQRTHSCPCPCSRGRGQFTALDCREDTGHLITPLADCI